MRGIYDVRNKHVACADSFASQVEIMIVNGSILYTTTDYSTVRIASTPFYEYYTHGVVYYVCTRPGWGNTVFLEYWSISITGVSVSRAAASSIETVSRTVSEHRISDEILRNTPKYTLILQYLILKILKY